MSNYYRNPFTRIPCDKNWSGAYLFKHGHLQRNQPIVSWAVNQISCGCQAINYTAINFSHQVINVHVASSYLHHKSNQIRSKRYAWNLFIAGKSRFVQVCWPWKSFEWLELNRWLFITAQLIIYGELTTFDRRNKNFSLYNWHS